MALGGVGLTLHDLATLYASLAERRRGGHAHAPAATRPKPDAARLLLHGKHIPPAKHILSPVAAWYVTDILKDAPPPLNAKGGRLAYKTGTSYGYRDAWAVGYDGKLHRRGVGRPPRRRLDAGPRRPPRRRAHSVRRLRPARRDARSPSRRRRPAPCAQPDRSCRRR